MIGHYYRSMESIDEECIHTGPSETSRSHMELDAEAYTYIAFPICTDPFAI